MSSEGDFHIPGNVTERNSWVPLLAAQKLINRPGWESLLYFRCQQLGRVEGGRHLFKGRPCQAGGKRLYRQSCGGGWGEHLPAETAQSSLTVICKSVVSGLTSIILVVLGVYSLSSVPWSICSHFFAVSSQNCGSSSPGYSLVIMQLTSPPGVLVSIRQLTGYGSEYYL